LDKLFDLLYNLFLFVLDKFPEISLPSGFEEGLPKLIEYGMILNKIIPIKEALAQLSLYVTILLVLTIYRFVKSWIPFV
jgi:hypothetical protein